MKKLRCRWCGYEFRQKGNIVPNLCPYCNESNGIEESFNSKKILKEIDEV
ncbi:hypothetical protein J4414_00825 [Candidatus Woesearchaeota archaeon]|nr:hypothetical protein [Candidatus Woesearchaeota archaeon]